MDVKLAILLPRADMFPTLAMDFLQGFKLNFEASLPNGISPKYLVESIGTGVDEQLLKTAEKLLLQDDPTITITFCGNNILHDLVKIFDSYKKPLIHIDLGGAVLKDDCISPYVTHHSLNIWEASYVAGAYAAENIGTKAVVISSMYDGGYHMAAAFSEAYTKKNGVVNHFYVAPIDYKSESYDGMIYGIKEAQPDVIFAIFSYKEGEKVFKAIANSDLNGKIQILAIPLMTDESYNTSNYKVENVTSIANWSFDDESESMKMFIANYINQYASKPNIIALLGYETSLIVSHSISSEGTITKSLNLLENKKIQTPRGLLECNDRNETFVDEFKARKFSYNETQYHNAVIEQIDVVDTNKLYQKFIELPNPGWQNPYICT